MARPRPVPPKRRVVDESACVNSVNSRAIVPSSIPMPESLTAMRSRGASPASIDASTRTNPLDVNLTALPTRLTRIWRRRRPSPASAAGTSAAIVDDSSRSLSFASGFNSAHTSAIASRGANGAVSTSMRPASSFDKLRMSSMMATRASPDWRAIPRYSRWTSWSGVSSSSVIIPSTPFIGVRISWLMVARKPPLAAVATSAFRRASSSICWFQASRSVSRRSRIDQKLQTATCSSAMPKWNTSFAIPTRPSKKFTSTPALLRIANQMCCPMIRKAPGHGARQSW